MSLNRVLSDIELERERQIAKWGEQRHADGTDEPEYRTLRQHYTLMNDTNERQGLDNTWDTILLEEVYEALSETDRERLRAELVQIATVCAAWIEDIDNRRG
jgi:hypothetical protein